MGGNNSLRRTLVLTDVKFKATEICMSSASCFSYIFQVEALMGKLTRPFAAIFGNYFVTVKQLGNNSSLDE